MTEGNMTGRPHGGANQRPGEGPLPGERPLGEGEREATTEPEQSPRAAREGEMTEARPFEGGAEPDAAPVSDPARP